MNRGAKKLEKGFARYGTTLTVYHHENESNGMHRISLRYVEQQLGGLCNCDGVYVEDSEKNEIRVKPYVKGCVGTRLTHKADKRGTMQICSTMFKNSDGARMLFKKGGKELIIRPS